MKKSKFLSLALIGFSAVTLASCGTKTNPIDSEKYSYELTLKPNASFLKTEKKSLKKLANGDVREVIDFEFVVPEKEVINVTNYNDLLIGANPLLLTPIAIEMDNDTVVRTLSAEETKSEFNPITEFSKSGYGDANIDSSIYNTEQIRTCYSISQSSSGTLQSKYYNVSIVIEDNEAPVLNQTSVAELPFTLDVDSIKSSLKTSILSYLTDNNSDTTITVTLKDDSILTGLSYLNKEQVMHFDATDSDGNKIENQEFKYKLVDELNYFENIDQTTVTDISYKSASIDYITNSFSTCSDIYNYKLLNKDELVTNEGTITDELKAVINKEQTAKYAVYEKDALVGEFEYKFRVIDDVAPVMKWVDDNIEVEEDYLSTLTADHDEYLNDRFYAGNFPYPMDLYKEILKYIYAVDEINDDCKLFLKISFTEDKVILPSFYFSDGKNETKKIMIGAAIDILNPLYEQFLRNYTVGLYDENGLVETL